jgi:hypothetical protein
MAKFNIKDGNIELRSCEDISTLAEVIFHTEDKDIQIANYSMEDGGHFVLKTDTFEAVKYKNFNIKLFEKMCFILLFLTKEFLLDEDQGLVIESIEEKNYNDLLDTMEPEENEELDDESEDNTEKK